MFDFESKGKPKNVYSLKEAQLKAADFCAYQERSQQEVRDKLYTYGLYPDEVEEVLSRLIVDGFLNEERFAIAYAGGKFRVKAWGRKKIIQGLKQHKVSAYCTQKGLDSIDEQEYRDKLCALVQKKIPPSIPKDTYKLQHKIARYLFGKGYEQELIWQCLRESFDSLDH